MYANDAGPRWLRIKGTVQLPVERLLDDAVSERAMARAEASYLATRLLSQMNIKKQPPILIEDVAMFLGVSLQNATFEGASFIYESAADIRNKNVTNIWAKRSLSWVEKRMAYAHAMGHLLLHHFTEKKVITCNRVDNPTGVFEQEAWSFARSLLMPLDIVKLELGSRSAFMTAKALAADFQVPEADMVRRLELLKD